MNRFSLDFVLAPATLAALVCYAAPSRAQEAPYYHFVCRFGEMGRRDTPRSYSYVKASPDGGLEMITQLSFHHAAHAAPSGMNLGECSWVDRPMNPSEPSLLVFVQSPPALFYTSFDGRGDTVSEG